MSATPITVDFARVTPIRQHSSGVIRDRGDAEDFRPRSADGKLLTAKQIRARARRRLEKTSARSRNRRLLTEQEFEALYKPVEEWDLEELAKGRPRNVHGNFSGACPKWITREVHERAMDRFKSVIKMEMGRQGVTALDTLDWILTDQKEDARGKPVVPPSVKLQASTFLLEHIVGKPTQRVESDISVKLQSILGTVLVNPNEALAPPSQGGRLGDGELNVPGYSLAHFPGHTIPIGTGEEEIVDGEVIEDGE